MPDQLYTVNQALAHLGQDPTDTIDLDLARAVVRKVLPHADAAFDAILEREPWRDAMFYATLSPSPGLSNFKWGYGYLLPADAMRVWSFGDEAWPCAKWERGLSIEPETGGERKVIWSNDPGPANCAYVRRIAWTSLSRALADAIGLELAARACANVTGDAQLADALSKRADRAVMTASGQDAVQAHGEDPRFLSTFAALRRRGG